MIFEVYGNRSRTNTNVLSETKALSFRWGDFAPSLVGDVTLSEEFCEDECKTQLPTSSLLEVRFCRRVRLF